MSIITPSRPKLLITHTTQGSLLRGTEIHITLKFENIGESAFAFKLQSIDFQLPRSSHNFTKLPDVQALHPRGSFSYSFDVTPQEEGLGWLTVRLSDADGGTIECYQGHDSASAMNQWSGPIYVLKPEDCRIIELLEKIAGVTKS